MGYVLIHAKPNVVINSYYYFQLRKDLARRDFSDSYVIYNVSTLVLAYPYVSKLSCSGKSIEVFFLPKSLYIKKPVLKWSENGVAIQ